MRPLSFDIVAAELSQTALQKLPDWWRRIDSNPSWRAYSEYGLAAGYGAIALVAALQLVRIQMRVPEYGWTTQKVFHLLNFLVAGLRVVVFTMWAKLSQQGAPVVSAVLLDLPGLMFFSTYTLLVLFWAEIYHQACSLSTSKLRPIFVVTNAIVYFIQAGLWVFTALASGEATEVGRVASCVFLALVSVAAAGGFMVYGGRLFLMLRRFPVESRGRTKKLREVGLVTVICATCFTLRAVIVAWSAFDKKNADLDVWRHPLLDIIYYSLVEIVPSALVLFILRRLPPRRNVQSNAAAAGAYQPLPQQPPSRPPQPPSGPQHSASPTKQAASKSQGSTVSAQLPTSQSQQQQPAPRAQGIVATPDDP